MNENKNSKVFEVKNLVSCEHFVKENEKPTPILNNISFEISKGECIGIFSREVKESVILVETLGNMRPFLRGEVKFNGEIISEKKKCSVDDLFYIDSTSLLYDHMNLLEELMFVTLGSHAYKHKKKEAVNVQKDMLDIITSLGLSKYVLMKIKDMRESMRLVILVLLASMSSSMTVICNFVNHKFNEEEINILNLIISKYRKEGKTFVVASNKFDIISKVTTKILVLNSEGIVSFKEREKIYEDYSSLTFYIESNDSSKVDDLVKRICSNIKFVTYIKGNRVYFKGVEMEDIISSNLMKSLARDKVEVTDIVSLKEKSNYDL